MRKNGKGQTTGCLLLSLKKGFLYLFLLFLVGCSLPKIIVYKDPLTPEEHINLGVTYEKQGKYDLAIKQYSAAADRLKIAYFYLGNAYFKKGDYKSAEKYYLKSLAYNPDHADTMNNLAWLYYTIGEKLDRAEELVRRAMELNPAKREIYEDTLLKIMRLKGKGKQ